MDAVRQAEVLQVLERVRPFIKGDGGDVELVDIADNGTVCVKLTGNCNGCASAGATLFDGIQTALQGQLAWVTGVENADGTAPTGGWLADVTAPVRRWQDQTTRQLRAAIEALEEYRPGAQIPEAVMRFVEGSIGKTASLLKFEEDVLYGAAEAVLGLEEGPIQVMRQEHELLNGMFAGFADAVRRFGLPDGPGAQALAQDLLRIGRAFELHLQKERTGLFEPLGSLPDDMKYELRADIARHAAHRGLTTLVEVKS